MERRFTQQDRASVQVRQEGDGPAVIEGYGAVFYDGTRATEFQLWPGVVERIMPGAFDRAIQEDDVRGLFNHGPDNVLGRTSAGTMRLSVDTRGLRYEIEPGDTSIGRDVKQHIERKDVTGSSFSFNVQTEEWRKEEVGGTVIEIREIKVVAPLYDTGPVTFPAYSGTTTGVRTPACMNEARVSYAAWKERGAQRARAADATETAARMAEIEATCGGAGS